MIIDGFGKVSALLTVYLDSLRRGSEEIRLVDGGKVAGWVTVLLHTSRP